MRCRQQHAHSPPWLECCSLLALRQVPALPPITDYVALDLALHITNGTVVLSDRQAIPFDDLTWADHGCDNHVRPTLHCRCAEQLLVQLRSDQLLECACCQTFHPPGDGGGGGGGGGGGWKSSVAGCEQAV